LHRFAEDPRKTQDNSTSFVFGQDFSQLTAAILHKPRPVSMPLRISEKVLARQWQKQSWHLHLALPRSQPRGLTNSSSATFKYF
jgi:hypothetical protein